MLQFLFCAKCLFSGFCATSLGKIYTIINKLITGYKLLIGFSYNSLLQFDISLLILLESSQFFMVRLDLLLGISFQIFSINSDMPVSVMVQAHV
jgi:hypothetical protein